MSQKNLSMKTRLRSGPMVNAPGTDARNMDSLEGCIALAHVAQEAEARIVFAEDVPSLFGRQLVSMPPRLGMLQWGAVRARSNVGVPTWRFERVAL